ncbi:MAG: glycosyltransferase family 39 protein [candidate division KSB1 bacterium]|nr:glycosyltransferase family 39 protein [candidate division KSB1 bacterium]
MRREKSLAYILLTALLLRVLFALVLPAKGFIFSDARHYDQAAKSLLAGEGLGPKYHRPPLYPLLMAGVYGLLGESFLAVRMAEAILGTLFCLLIFTVGKRVFNPTIGLIAAALAAVHPHFILVAGILYPTHLYAILLAAMIWLLLRYDERNSFVDLIAAAVFAALAAYTVPALFFFLPFILLWLLWKPTGFQAKASAVGLFSLIFLLALLPWTLHNYRLYGRLTLVQPVPHNVFPNLDNLQAQEEKIKSGFPEVTEYRKQHPLGTDQDRLDRILLRYITHPWQSMRYLVGELGHFWALYPDRLDTASAGYQQHITARDSRFVALKSQLWAAARMLSIAVMAPVFFLALVGLVVTLPWQRGQGLILAVILSQAIGYSLIYAEVRYRIPIEPYVLMFTSAGAVWLKQRFDSRKIHQKLSETTP